MRLINKEYIKLCKKILKDGVEVENRTGTNTIKIPSYHLKFDLAKEFPVLTTKQLYFRQAILEMLWIYQAQSNDVRWLQERNVHIWDEWQIDENGLWKANQMVLENGKLVKKEWSQMSEIGISSICTLFLCIRFRRRSRGPSNFSSLYVISSTVSAPVPIGQRNIGIRLHSPYIPSST